MMTIRYSGLSNSRVVRDVDFAAAGFAGQSSLTWNVGNSYEREVSDDLAIFLLAQGEFVTAEGLNLGQVLAAGTGGRLLGQAKNVGGTVSNPAGVGTVDVVSKLVTVGTRDIAVRYGGYGFSNTIDQGIVAYLYEGAVKLDEFAITAPRVNGTFMVLGEWLPDIKPAAGDHTYTFKFGGSAAGVVASLFCIATAPGFIRIFEV